MVLRESKDPLNTSRGIMGPLENSAGVQNNRGRLKQRFDLIRKLGQGTYGKVQLGIDKETGQEVAIKTIKKSKIETEADLIRIRREIQIMSSVRHPNIIHIYEVFENREKMVLVMEYAAGGELYDYLNERKILQEDEARRIFRQIASAVYYCHKNKICHRDLKLENILLDEESNAKIADFGLSNVFDDVNLLKTFCGSPLYASPEIVKGTPYSGPEVDCWSLGVLLYTLVYGAMPFDGSNFKRLVKQISGGDYYEPKKPAEASPLIRIMLTVDPHKRAKVDEICSHSWINQGFDEDCLKCAEDLAKQTPVRLDVLLTLAPNHNINHSQVLIPPSNENDEGAPPPSSSQQNNHQSSDTNINESPKKQKLLNDKAAPSPTTPQGKEGGVVKPKRKVQSKTKSKTTPLMLDLIADVEEEVEEGGDVEMSQPAPQAPTNEKGQPGQDDDDADTLSEISEIQTIAEDVEVKGLNRGARSKSVKDRTSTPKESHESRPKITKTTPATISKPPAELPVKPEVKKLPEVKEKKEIPPPKETPREEIKKPSEPEVVKAPEPPPPTEEKVSPKTVVKKKVLKPKAQPAAAVVSDSAESEPEKVTTKKKPEEKVKSSEGPQEKVKSSGGEGSSNEKESDQGTGTSGSGSGSDTNNKKSKLIRERSGSVSDVSPTRVERRNSKVISQKTAELIQNLETKSSTSPGGVPNGNKETTPERRPPGIKKLVIPSFSKVSDAKSKFETKPPRPIPITSSLMSQSKAAFEAKAQAQATEALKKSSPPTATESKTKEKVADKTASESPKETKEIPKEPTKESFPVAVETKPKSSSPKPEVEKKATLATETPQKSPAVSPKPKPKVAKKSTDEEKVASAPTPEIPKASPLVAAAKVPEVKPEVKAPTAKVGKIQIPSGLQSGNAPEVKPVILDTGRGPPKPVPMLIKGKITSPTPPVDNQNDKVKEPSVEVKPLPLSTSQSKEQAAKKISSVINKIVTSGSSDKFGNKKKGSESGTGSEGETGGLVTHKTEVSFPVAAAPSTERVIPIKFEDNKEEEPEVEEMFSPPGTTQQTPSGSRTQIPRFPPRFDSFKRFDSASSMFSRQNSSDTESCSLAPPKPEAIKKSPREFLIPIKLEGSGQTVMPKEDVVNSEGANSEDDFRIDSRLRSGRFGRHKRYSSLLSDSSLEEDPSASTAAGVRRPSTASMTAGSTPVPVVSGSVAHARSRSTGDEPQTPTTTFKRYRIKRPDLDRSDSFSSAEEDDEDFFEVLTADSLFTNLLDRVRNLTKRLNREGSVGPNWPTPNNDPTNFGLWNPSSSLRDLMTRAPSESRTIGFSSGGRPISREPSVSVTINRGGSSSGGPGGWRGSLSRDVSGESDYSGGGGGGNIGSRSESNNIKVEKVDSASSCSSANPHSSSSSSNPPTNNNNTRSNSSVEDDDDEPRPKQFTIPIQFIQDD